MSDLEAPEPVVGHSAPPDLPEPLAMKTEWQPFLPRWDLFLTSDGISWKRKGREPLWAQSSVLRAAEDADE